MEKKICVMTISDNPIGRPTGVSTQTRYMIEGLLKTGRYKVVSIAASDQGSMTPTKTEEYGDDWEILPTKGYGDPGMIRSLLRIKRPDILWFMTDPRYYWWLWNMENEVRPNVSMVYYNIWDNYPYPTFNRKYYESTDVLVAISKLTFDILRTVAPNTPSYYLTHAVDPAFFHKKSQDEVAAFRKHALGPDANKYIFFWNNRNQKRKQAGSLIWAFKDFCDKVGHDKAVLLMHTNPKEMAGPDLEANLVATGLTKGQVRFSTEKAMPPQHLGMMYNMSDCTINVSDSEGHGLAVTESLACGVPVIATLTGGMTPQVINDDGIHLGVGLKPDASPIVGSQQIPFIYEDHVSRESIVNALCHMYAMPKEEKERLSLLAVEHINKNFNFEFYKTEWDRILTETYTNNGSWPRKNYKAWSLMEV